MWKLKVIPIWLWIGQVGVRNQKSQSSNSAPAIFCHIAAALSNWSHEKVVCRHPVFPYGKNICLIRSGLSTTGADDDADFLVLSKMPYCQLAL